MEVDIHIDIDNTDQPHKQQPQPQQQQPQPQQQRQHQQQQQQHRFLSSSSSTSSSSNPFHQLLSDYGGITFSSSHTSNNNNNNNNHNADPFYRLDSPQRLRIYLENQFSLYPNIIQTFIQQITLYCKDIQQLRKMLIPTIPIISSISTTGVDSHQHQPSLLRVLLSVSVLQSSLVDWLLESLASEGDRWLEYEGLSSLSGVRLSSSSSLPSSSIPRLVLNQLRWLDVIYDGEKLSQKILTVLESCTIIIQRELITMIPEIIDDLHHNIIATSFIQLLTHDEHQQLSLPILDALSHCHVTTQQADILVTKVKSMIAAAPLKQLPVITKFLLRSANVDNAKDIITVIRKDLSLLGLHPYSSTTLASRFNHYYGKDEKADNNNDGESISTSVLLVSALRSALQFSPLIIKTYVQIIQQLPLHKEFKLIDMLILIIIHQLPPHQKLIQTLFKQKISTDCITIPLIQSTITELTPCLQPLFETLAILAASLVRQAAPRVRSAGGHMQMMLFVSFTSINHRRIIIDHFLQHLGSKRQLEMNCALNSMKLLATHHTAEMKPFYAFIKSVQQYLDDLSIYQVRQLFQSFASLCIDHGDRTRYGDGDEDRDQLLIEPSLMSLITKNLSLSFSHQRIGIIAAIAIIQEIATPTAESANTPLSTPSHSEVMKLFDLLNSHSSHQPAYLAFLYDELSRSLMTNNLHADVLRIIRQHYIDQVEQLMLIDLPTDRDDLRSMELPMWEYGDLMATALYGLDSNSDIGIPITTVLAYSQPEPAHHHQHDILLFCPLMRLLTAIERRSAGGLQDVDALIGAALCLPSRPTNITDELDEEYVKQQQRVEDITMRDSHLLSTFSEKCCATQILIISSLFHAINWCRELLNTWCGFHLAENNNVSVEYLASLPKLRSRLELIIQLESELKLYVNSLPLFSPSQLLGMGGTTDPDIINEIQRMEGGANSTEIESHKYTQLGRMKIEQRKKQQPHHNRKKHSVSNDDDSSESRSDREADEIRRKKKKRKNGGGPSSSKKAEPETKHYQQSIVPFFRPLELSAFQLLHLPLPARFQKAAREATPPNNRNNGKKRQRDADQEQKQGADHDSERKKLCKTDEQIEENKLDDRREDETMRGSDNTSDNDHPILAVSSLCFLLDDLYMKMKSVLLRSSIPIAFFAASRKSSVVSSANLLTLHQGYTPAMLLQEILPILPAIHEHYCAITAFLRSDDSRECNLTDKADREKLFHCLLTMTSMIKLIVQCESLNNTDDRKLVKDALSRLATPLTRLPDHLSSSAISTISNLLRSSLFAVGQLDDAVSILSVMHLVLDYGSSVSSADVSLNTSNTKHDVLSKLANDLLSVNDWLDHDPLKRGNITKLVTLHVRHSKDPLTSIRLIITRMHYLFDHAEDESDNDSNDNNNDNAAANNNNNNNNIFRSTLTLKSLPLFLSPLLEELLFDFNNFSKENFTGASLFLARFGLYGDASKSLMNMCQHYGESTVSLLTAACKFGRQFIQRCIKLLPSIPAPTSLSTNAINTVHTLLRTLQASTRSLQIILSHGSSQRIISIVSLAPSVKKQLDAFIYAVKGWMKEGGLDNTLSIGQLKRKKLDGTELISSQQQPPYHRHYQRTSQSQSTGATPSTSDSESENNSGSGSDSEQTSESD